MSICFRNVWGRRHEKCPFICVCVCSYQLNCLEPNLIYSNILWEKFFTLFCYKPARYKKKYKIL